MKNQLIIALLIVYSTNIWSQVNFCDPELVDKLEKGYDEQLIVMPDFELPVINVKKLKTRKLVKSIKVPEFLLGAGFYKNRYWYAYSDSNLYKIDVITEEIESFPHNKKGKLSAKYDNQPYEWKFIYSEDGNMFLYRISKKANIPLAIYQADFNLKQIIPTLEPSFLLKKGSSVIKGQASNHLFIANLDGQAMIIDLNSKKVILDTQFEVPISIAQLENHLKSLNFNQSYNGWFQRNCSIVNYNISSYRSEQKLFIFYDVAQNKLLMSKIVNGYLGELLTEKKIYWTVLNQSEGTFVIYEDRDLNKIRFQFNGLIENNPYKFNYNKELSNINSVQVSYKSGKVKTYDWTTKKLIKTEEAQVKVTDF